MARIESGILSHGTDLVQQTVASLPPSWSVIEHDDTCCSRCMQLEIAKRLVDGVVVIRLGGYARRTGHIALRARQARDRALMDPVNRSTWLTK